MANKEVHRFISAVTNSPELRARTQKALDGSKDPKAFVAVAKAAGYEFSEQDASKYFDEVLAANRPGELADKELEQISGGKDVSLRLRSPLNDTVKMLQGMTFKVSPSWTGFQF